MAIICIDISKLLTCQYLEEHLSIQVFSPTFRSLSLYLHNRNNHAHYDMTHQYHQETLSLIPLSQRKFILRDQTHTMHGSALQELMPDCLLSVNTFLEARGNHPVEEQISQILATKF